MVEAGDNPVLSHWDPVYRFAGEEFYVNTEALSLINSVYLLFTARETHLLNDML